MIRILDDDGFLTETSREALKNLIRSQGWAVLKFMTDQAKIQLQEASCSLRDKTYTAVLEKRMPEQAASAENIATSIMLLVKEMQTIDKLMSYPELSLERSQNELEPKPQDEQK